MFRKFSAQSSFISSPEKKGEIMGFSEWDGRGVGVQIAKTEIIIKSSI